MKKILLLAILSFGLNTGILADAIQTTPSDEFAQFDKIVTPDDTYKKTCGLGVGRHCYILGFMYNTGQGVEQSYFEAEEYYQKACGLNEGFGCVNLGTMYYIGTGVKQSNTKPWHTTAKLVI